MKPYSFRFPEALYQQLVEHLFPGDDDEHGAVIAAGICETERGIRFLARRVFVAQEGADYGPGRHGYRALSADFVLRVSDYCAREKLCYFSVHCHGGSDSVSFSATDLASHERGYPSLLDITHDGPVGALVFARNAVAGSIWTRTGVFFLDHAVIVGANLRVLRPDKDACVAGVDSMFARQALIFGAAGQKRLVEAKIGIIGLGGAGSLISQWLVHLGVGDIVGVDPERLVPSNRSRVVGSTPWDAPEFLLEHRWDWVRRIGRRLARKKVEIAARVARYANPRVRFCKLFGDVTVERFAREFRDVDYLFLCADTHQCRHIFNTLVHQYLIPGVQMGSKVPVESASGQVGDLFAVARPVLPSPGGGCLWCNELISPVRLQEEALTAAERARQAYVDEDQVVAPSVITLNAVACAQAANDFLLGYFGLIAPAAAAGYLLNYGRERHWATIECRHDSGCHTCGNTASSAFARGDRACLPCRTSGD